MKKVILSLAALALSISSFAQTHSAISGNAPTAGLTGYAFNFNGTDANNCKAGGGIAYYGGVVNQSWSVDGSGKLVVTVPTMTVYDDSRQLAKFYSGDCVAASIDLSSTANQKMTIDITNSTDNGQMVVVIYSGAQSNYSASGVNIFDVAVGANTFSVNTLDLTGITNTADITGVGFFFRGPAGWGDFDFAGTVTIESIVIGDAIVAGTQAEVNNSLVSVYPNPAKDQINVDLSSLNTNNATVKIMNANGTVVYEKAASNSNEMISTASFNKGIYMVQVSAGNKVSNKKLVIE